jgi:hypothetical protein
VGVGCLAVLTVALGQRARRERRKEMGG